MKSFEKWMGKYIIHNMLVYKKPYFYKLYYRAYCQERVCNISFVKWNIYKNTLILK